MSREYSKEEIVQHLSLFLRFYSKDFNEGFAHVINLKNFISSSSSKGKFKKVYETLVTLENNLSKSKDTDEKKLKILIKEVEKIIGEVSLFREL